MIKIHKKTRRPTLHDVAKLAQTSVMTVSNVINHKESVAEPYKKRVISAIKEIGYRPNTRGRNLKLARAFTVGFVIIHPDRKFLDDPFVTQLAAGISNILVNHNYGMLVTGTQSINEIESVLDNIANLDSVIMLVSGIESERVKAYRRISSCGMPTVIIQDSVPGDMTDVFSIEQTDRKGSACLATSLIKSGVRKILFVETRHAWRAIEQRKKGAIDAVNNFVEIDFLSVDDSNISEALITIRDKLESCKSIEAVMGATDQIGIAAVQAAKSLGIKVPHEMKITGFNGFYFRDYFSPLLTSVESPSYEMGELTAKIILNRLEVGFFKDVNLLLPTKILKGNTI